MTKYIIYKDGNTIKAENEKTGMEEFTGTDISVILTSINGAISEKGTITIKEGIYIPTSQVRFTKSVELIGDGNVVFDWNAPAEFLFTFQGSELTTTTLTANVSAGTNNVPISNIGNAQPGDLLLIYDNTIFSPADFPNWKTGELHEIFSISGNIITISDSIINNFSTSQSGSVRLIRPITVEINGIVIIGVDGTADYRGIQFYYTTNSLVRNSKLLKNGRTEIEIVYSYNTRIENNIIGDNILAGFGYGIDLSDAVAFTTISDNYFYNARCTITQGGSGVVGQARDTMIIGNLFADSTGSSSVIDSHAIAESLYIFNNTIFPPLASYAIGSGAKITKVMGNTIIGGKGVMSYGSTIQYFEIISNTFLNSYQIFYGNNLNQYQLDIKNNSITGNIGAIARFWNTTSFNVSGNNFNSTNIGAGEWGIQVNNSINGMISNNYINNPYLSGIKFISVKNTIISNNIISLYNNYGSNTEFGIRLDNSTHNDIYDNILIKPNDENTYGIGELGTSDYNRIYDNDLSGVGSIAVTSQRIKLVGKNSISYLRNNLGYKTDNNVLSTAFPIDSTGIKTVTISYGLAKTPNVQDCCLTVIKNSNVNDWGYSLLMVDSVGANNVIAKIYISTASATVGATAKLALRVGNP